MFDVGAQFLHIVENGTRWASANGGGHNGRMRYHNSRKEQTAG